MSSAAGPEALDELVLSAERLEVGTRRRVRERVRVRREVVTEEVAVTVTVRREVLRVERETPSDGGADERDGAVDGAADGAVDGASSTSGAAPVLEVVLSEERPVVSLEVVPYERVRVGVREVTSDTWVATSRSREVLDGGVVQTGAGDAGAG